MRASILHRFEASRRFALVFLIVVLLVRLDHVVHAQNTFLLEDNNASMVVNTNIQKAASSWQVNGIEQLNELSNWFRTGSAGPEASTHTLQLLTAFAFNTNGDPRNDAATVVYSRGGLAPFEIRFNYGVVGDAGGAYTSRMGENVFITNIGAQPLVFHFFEYVDLNLTNSANDDLGTPAINGGDQQDGTTLVHAGISQFDRHEMTFINAVPSTLSKLTDGVPSNLSNLAPFGNTISPGDVTWALQWDWQGLAPPRPQIGPGQTVMINKEWLLTPVPEPGTMGVLAMGVVAALRHRKRSNA